MSTSIRMFSNATAQWIATGINAVIGIVLVPFLLIQLGQEGYGLIGLLGSVASLNMIADLGFSGALSRNLAEQIALKDTRRFNEIASTALCYYLVVGAMPALVCVLFASPIAGFFKVPDKLMDQAIFLIRWYSSASLFMTLVQSVFRGVITSNARFAALNILDSSLSLLKAVGLFVVLGLTDSGLLGWAGVLLFTQAIAIPALWRIARAARPSLALNLRLFSNTALRQLFRLGSNLFVLRLTRLISTTSDPMVISAFLGPAAVAIYTPALALVGAFRPLIDTLSQQLHPLTTGYHVTGHTRQLQMVLIRGTRFTFLMGVGACVFVFFFAEPLTRIWLHDSLGQSYLITTTVLMLWSAVDLITYAAGSQWPVLLGMNRLRFLIWSQVLPAFLNVAFSILLIQHTQLGVIAVVIPTLVINLLRRPLVAAYTARVCGLPARTYFREAYLGGMALIALLSAVAWTVRTMLQPDSLLTLGASALIYGLAWSGFAWFLGFKSEDRAAFLEIWQRAYRPLTSR